VSYFPLFLGLKGKSVLIIGAGKIALSKLQIISEFTKDVHILSDNFSDLLLKFSSENGVELIQSKYHKLSLEKYDIIIGATNDRIVNNQISEDAKDLGKIVNIVDNPDISDFIFGAIVKRGDISISISSSGISPVFSRLIKREIEKILPENLSDLGEFIKINRHKVKNKLTNLQPRRLFWEEILEGDIGKDVLNYDKSTAQSKLNHKLSINENHNKSELYLIGSGPGDPDLVTLKAIKLLSKADVVLHDRLVSKQILNYARKDSVMINVGKTKDCHLYSQNEINQLITKYLKEGNIVARLKGGDVSIFAHLYEEIDVAKDLNLPYQIVPGISAASGASASSAISLTARNIAKSVRFLTFYKKDSENSKYWKDLASTNDTLIFYMSSQNALLITQNLIRYGKNPSIEIAVIEQATTKYQKTNISTLVDFKQKKFSSPSLIIIGDVVNLSKKYQWKEEGEIGEYFSKLNKIRHEI
tara:strand:- start:12326 stop:13744 length:1419 start_codon:yes stop_codon:yes gene_type:complete